jgi:Zn-dependent protease with chaperone function
VKFDPSLPKDGINVSLTHPLREALLLVVGVIAVAAVVAMLLASVVDWLAPQIPARLESRLFSGWVSSAFEDDVEIESRERALAEILNRIAAHWPENPYLLRVRIWDTPEPNAVALPGGLIAVTTGLLESVESENELAFTLGHELGHFHNRDHLRGLGRGLAFSLVVAAVGLSGGGGVGQLASMAGQFTQRGFDREQERQADRFGLKLIAAEYGHTAGATDLFEHLPTAESKMPKTLSSYLATHPLHEDRIDALREAARLAGWTSNGTRLELPTSLIPTNEEPEADSPLSE